MHWHKPRMTSEGPAMVYIPGRGQVHEQKTTSTFLIALSMTHDILLLIFPDHSLTPMPTETCDAHLGLTVLLM